MPLIVALRNQGMRQRHWDQLSTDLGFKLDVTDPNLTLKSMLQLGLQSSFAIIQKVHFFAFVFWLTS